MTVGTAQGRFIATALAALPFAVGGASLCLRPAAPHPFGCSGSLSGAPLEHSARCDRGATVTASSLALEAGHHPLFVIDGRVGGPLEKWMSRESDERPWIEVALPAPRAVRRIVIHHAGEREPARYNTADFDVSVLSGGTWATAAEVRGNRAAVTSAAWSGGPVSRVRVTVSKPNAGLDAHARLYEIEARDD